MDSETKAYIAGFLDGDGCIMFQLVYRHDYIYKYQVRASIVFYQKQKNRSILDWLHSLFQIGYIRNRNDGMSEYTIVGLKSVMNILQLLAPYVRLKKRHIKLAQKIYDLFPYYQHIDPKQLVEAALLIDQYKVLNYSKKRTNTSKVVIESLRENGYIPCND